MLRTVVRPVGLLVTLLAALCLTTRAQTPQPFTIRQALSAPYATDLTAAPVPDLYAWVVDAEGRRNLYIGGAAKPARALTHNTEDDAQDIIALAWSPDATQIAYTYGAETGADGKPANPAHLQHPTPLSLMVQDTAAGSQPRNLGEGRSPLFTHDGRSLLFVRAGQVWIADLASGAPTQQLIFDRGSASQLALSPNGSLLAFTSTRRSSGSEHSFVALFDMVAHTLMFAAPATDSDFSPSFSPDGRSLAWLRQPFTQPTEYAPNRTSANPWSIQLADLAACSDPPGSPDPRDALASGVTSCGVGSRTLFSPQPNGPGSVLPHLSTGDPRLFFLADQRIVFASEADGWNHLYLLDWQHGQPPTPLTPGAFEVDDVTLDHNRSTLYYAANDPAADALDGDRRHLYRIEIKPAAAPSKPQALTHGAGIETHPQDGGTSLAGLFASVAELMHPVVITGPEHTAKTLLAAGPPPDYPGARFVTPKQILLHAADGTPLHAQLFEPPADAPKVQRRAALLFFHGGPRRQMLLGFPSMDYYSNAYAMNQYLASRGFIVLSINYRGSIGYGLDFRQCLHCGPEGASEYQDALAGAAWLRARPDVDPRRIGVWGGSYGGYFVALALARNSDIFAAGVDFHGVHEWPQGTYEPDPPLRGSSADQDRRAAVAHASSPMADIDHWRSPVLLIHGDDDSHVAYTQTPLLADALRAGGVPVEELIFPDEQHGFLLHRDWVRAYEATAEFLERKLHPER